MSNQKLDERIKQAHTQIKETEALITEAQETNPDLIEQAYDQLNRAEESLKQIQKSSGSATDIPQFQQAFEQLHNIRGNIQDLHQNNPDL